MPRHPSRRARALLLALALLLLVTPAARAATTVPLDGSVTATWFYAYCGGQQLATAVPDATPPASPSTSCGAYTSTNGSIAYSFGDHTAGPAIASAYIDSPSRSGTLSLLADGATIASEPIPAGTSGWVTLPSAHVTAGQALAVKVAMGWRDSTGRTRLFALHLEVGDDPIAYGKPGGFWRTPIPSDVAVNATTTANLQTELAGEVTSTNKAAVNSGAWTQPVYRFTPDTPRVSVWLWRSSFGTAQPKYIGPRQSQLNVGDPAAMTGVPDPDLLGWQPAPAPDSDQEYVAICAACSSPDGAYTGYDVELWKFHRCTASDLTYAPNDPATGAPYVWCAGEGGRDTGTDQSAGHPITDMQGYPYGTWPDPFTDAVHVSKYEDKGGLATATSLPNAAGEVTEADVQADAIDHPIGFSLIYPVPGHVWPAQRDDGWASAPHAVKEGERFYLPASTDCSAAAVPAPLGQMICVALKTYGGVLWDKAGAFSMRVEPAVKQDPIWNGIGGSSQLDGIDWTTVQVVGNETTGDYGSDSHAFPLAG